VEQKNKDELKNAVALFRYGLISAVVNDTFEDKSQNEYFRRIAQSNYTFLGKKV